VNVTEVIKDDDAAAAAAMMMMCCVACELCMAQTYVKMAFTAAVLAKKLSKKFASSFTIVSFRFSATL